VIFLPEIKKKLQTRRICMLTFAALAAAVDF